MYVNLFLLFLVLFLINYLFSCKVSVILTIEVIVIMVTKKDEWNKLVATILKNEIRRNLETYESLAKKLGEDTGVTRNKINRGTFRASYFLRALVLLGVKQIEVPETNDDK